MSFLGKHILLDPTIPLNVIQSSWRVSSKPIINTVYVDANLLAGLVQSTWQICNRHAAIATQCCLKSFNCGRNYLFPWKSQCFFLKKAIRQYLADKFEKLCFGKDFHGFLKIPCRCLKYVILCSFYHNWFGCNKQAVNVLDAGCCSIHRSELLWHSCVTISTC